MTLDDLATGPSGKRLQSLLARSREGDREAGAELFRLLYEELHERARSLMRRQRPGHTIQATALVNEAFLRLMGGGGEGWADRTHVLRTASRAMRQILIDHARRRRSTKRDPGGEPVPLDSIVCSFEDRSIDLLALDEALQQLQEFDPDMAKAVDLRFFGGLTLPETARALEIPLRSFERRWSMARDWLYARLT